MLTTVLLYEGNRHAFSQLFISIQTQLNSSDDIYILDMSQDKSGFLMANYYGSTRCYIFVEPVKKDFEKSIRFGLQSAVENKQQGVLILPPNCVVSATFISSIKRASSQFDILTTPTHFPIGGFDPDFSWFNSQLIVKEISQFSKTNVLYIKTSQITKEFRLSSAQKRVGLIESEPVLIIQDF